ncbi:flagellar assembly protein FliH [Alteromonas sp. a30]|uniref:flagellar assembly protein FliH n=1 Tax=Alteromonas sp. a30 TaxID=2730917 RepID=UPI002282F87D|nr:flagellar assembly protein FliH [Alteromonas sp. a30]MCY7294431.1 flagellar assembly protein FliH [Alteromonas sp. a30]
MITNEPIADEAAAEVKAWELPVIDEQKVNTGSTNALGRTSEWKYEPPEEEEVVLPPTLEEIEAIRQNAYEEGLEQGTQEGLEKGYQEGFEKGQAEGHEQGVQAGQEQGLQAGEAIIQEQVGVWQELMQKLHTPVESVQQELQKELVALSVGLARAVIKQEVKTNPDVIFQALAEGLKVLPIGEKSYQIRMNPEDIALIKTQYTQEDIERHRWIFIESPELSRGGCDITTESNAVDLTVERRCRDVLDKFLHEQGLSSEVVAND